MKKKAKAKIAEDVCARSIEHSLIFKMGSGLLFYSCDSWLEKKVANLG